MQANNDPLGVLKSDKHLQPPNIDEYNGPVCCECGESLGLTKFINGDYVCNWCMRSYIEKNAGDFIQPYINENQESYYLDWWFDNLPKQDKLDIVLKGYFDRNVIQKMTGFNDMALDRIEFCLDTDDFYEYVRMRMC